MNGFMCRVAVAVALCAATATAWSEPADAHAPFSRVTIGDATYRTANALSVAALLPLNPSIRTVLRVARACRGVEAHAFLGRRGAGIAAWVPDSLAGCLGVSGGGPTGSACLQSFRTPADQDPADLTNVATRRSLVMFAATGPEACADISTQVPGGVWGQTTVAVPGLPVDSLMLVKCQLQTGQGLVDYVAEYRPRVPASKAAFWIPDAWVNTSILTRLDGVPSCSGVGGG